MSPRHLVLIALITAAIGGVTFMVFDPGNTALPEGTHERSRQERILKSPQFKNGKFVNTLPTHEDAWQALKRWLLASDPSATPTSDLPVIYRKAQEFDVPPVSGLRVTWLGHSSTLIEVHGKRFLTDPVWGERASPSSHFGPKRFFAPPLPLSELPKIDAIVLSHDHFDHLDESTIKALKDLPTTFIAPLGVGERLARWGVPEERIIELDWWETTNVGGVTLVCTPARHFSGRSLLDRDKTLWSGWAIVAPEHRVFFSGDTGMFPGFAEIGAKYGPFDLTLMESGAYDFSWPDVHLGPEQAVAAHLALRGKVMLPVHWGTFNLAIHGWTEPAERILVAAQAQQVKVTFPRPGESIEPALVGVPVRWWPEVPWKTAEQSPVFSTGQ